MKQYIGWVNTKQKNSTNVDRFYGIYDICRRIYSDGRKTCYKLRFWKECTIKKNKSIKFKLNCNFMPILINK